MLIHVLLIVIWNLATHPLTKGTKGRIASSPCIGVYGHGSFHKVKSNLRFYSPHTSVENKSY